MAEHKAFALKAHLEEDFVGGSVAIGPEGHTLDLGEALGRHEKYGPKGVIVTDDPLVQAALDSPGLREAFKSVSVPQPRHQPKAKDGDKSESSAKE